MTAYAIADLHRVRRGPAIAEYLEKIDATLAPFGGRFLVHGGRKTVLEGEWPGTIVVIAFPDRAAAAAWYASPDYQAILPLRTANSEGDVVLTQGVGRDRKATDVLAERAV